MRLGSHIFSQDLQASGVVAVAAFTNASLWLASRGLMLAFIAAAASADVETPLRNSKTITDGLTVGEVKTYKLVLEVNVCSDPTR